MYMYICVNHHSLSNSVTYEIQSKAKGLKQKGHISEMDKLMKIGWIFLFSSLHFHVSPRVSYHIFVTYVIFGFVIANTIPIFMTN